MGSCNSQNKILYMNGSWKKLRSFDRSNVLDKLTACWQVKISIDK